MCLVFVQSTHKQKLLNGFMVTLRREVMVKKKILNDIFILQVLCWVNIWLITEMSVTASWSSWQFTINSNYLPSLTSSLFAEIP